MENLTLLQNIPDFLGTVSRKEKKVKIRFRNSFLIGLTILSAFGCSGKDQKSDAYGNFETTEVIVSAENGGKLQNVAVDEGDQITIGQVLATGDAVALQLKKDQILAEKAASASKRAGFKAQIAIYQAQRKTNQTNYQRFKRMLSDGASTQKQVDDLAGQLSVLNRQIESVHTQFSSLDRELSVADTQVAQINDQIKRSQVKSPVNGTVLERYHETGEMVAPGTPLFKVADLSFLNLKVYVSGAQLPHIHLGQKVKVLIDEDTKTNRSLEGTISWISSAAEFTPKIIQTKEERVKQVYAIKVRVPNGGQLKIGMPGEVNF